MLNTRESAMQLLVESAVPGEQNATGSVQSALSATMREQLVYMQQARTRHR